jgi:hypothetical protein
MLVEQRDGEVMELELIVCIGQEGGSNLEAEIPSRCSGSVFEAPPRGGAGGERSNAAEGSPLPLM